MKLLTKENYIKERLEYLESLVHSPHLEHIKDHVSLLKVEHDKLKKLPRNPTDEEVFEATHNHGERCIECLKVGWDMVNLGEEPDYDVEWAILCLDCLQKAVKLCNS